MQASSTLFEDSTTDIYVVRRDGSTTPLEINKIHQLSETPIKKLKGKKLTKEQKKYNRELNRLRITVEHVNRRLKIFKILSDRYRNRHRRFGLRSNLIAGIYNHELAL